MISLWRRYSDVVLSLSHLVAPPERISPSEFAARYRVLSEVESSERPGKWDNGYFPFLGPIMDSVQDAIVSGKRGWVMMKSAQGGGSQAMINVWAWLQASYAAPILYLISKDELADEFGRERFTQCLDTMEPLKRKALRGKSSGESLTKKRFTDGKLVLCGGRSVLNLQSQAYRFVMIDEVDSLLDEIKNSGDPIKLAEMRMNSYRGQTLLMAFAHPSLKERGSANLFYALSDQRRGHVACVHCRTEIWLQWSHVKIVASAGMSQQQAERDPRCYAYYCPQCGAEISDADRAYMVRSVRYKSILLPEEARKRTWVGVHFSALYMPNWPVRKLAEHWIASMDDASARMVFWNKLMGEPFEQSVKETSVEDWRRVIVIPRKQNDPEAYVRGQVPPGVRFLTAGQDSGEYRLHYAVWGWGLVRTVAGHTALRGWLVDWNSYKVSHPVRDLIALADLHALDEMVYYAAWPSTREELPSLSVSQCGHDTGFSPSTVYQYCREFYGRAYPVKGGSENSSTGREPVRFGANVTFVDVNGIRHDDPGMKLLVLNTYTLKSQIFGWLKEDLEVPDGANKRVVPRLTLPGDVDDEMISHLASEELRHVNGTKGKTEWKAKGANHYLDCLVYAYGLALNLDVFQQGLPFDEVQPEEDSSAVIGKAWK
jgi:phage terminase large subunit GpA-like protein